MGSFFVCHREQSLKNFSQSIVIPTRNRQETAIFAIESCLRVDYENKQIVVVDNSDDDSLRNLLSEAGWLDAVTYHKTAEVLSMTDNWERGLELAEGELVSVIGDDDAILSSSMAVANFVFNSADIDVLTGATAIYKWPTYPYQGRRNYLYFEFGEEVNIVRDPNSLLRSAYQYEAKLGTGPGLYYGFVKKEFLNRVKQKRGRYLIDVNPDFDSGYCTLLYARAYARSKRPLFVHGHSGKSNSGTMRFALAKKRNVDKFSAETKQSKSKIFSEELAGLVTVEAAILAAQMRFKVEVDEVLGPGAVTLNKEGAWAEIMKGIRRSYDVTEFIGSIPALKRISEEWGVPYEISDHFEPASVDSSLPAEQGFQGKGPSTSGTAGGSAPAGYSSVVVNGAYLGFQNILDAVRHIDAMLPTMRASENKEVLEATLAQAKNTMQPVLKNARYHISVGAFSKAMILLDDVMAAGHIGLTLDDEVIAVAENLGAFEWGAAYFAREFSSRGDAGALKSLLAMYRNLGADDEISRFLHGAERLTGVPVTNAEDR